MLPRAVRFAFIVLLACPLLSYSVGIGAQDESVEQEPALIVYTCSNGFNVKNICAIDENGNGPMRVTDTIYSSRESEDPSVNAHGQIAYVCQIEEDRSDICMINADGSGYERKTFLSEFPNNFSPSINDDGLIAHLCYEDFEELHLCVIDPGTASSNSLELDIRLNNRGFLDVGIDNFGRIVFKCTIGLVSDDLCVVHANGTGLQSITNETRVLTEYLSFSVNGRGQVAFACRDQEFGTGVCRTDLDSFESALIVHGNPKLELSRVYMNDAGQVAFTCEPDNGLENEICVTTWDGESERIITTTGNNFEHTVVAITTNGVIVHSCGMRDRNVGSRLCMVNFDGSGLIETVYFNNNEENDRPLINNRGQIVFHCHGNYVLVDICLFDDVHSELVNLNTRFELSSFQFSMVMDFNDQGQIASDCSFPDSDKVQVCLFDLDANSIEIFNERSAFIGFELQEPSINNNGLLAFECVDAKRVSHLCIASADGTHNDVIDLPQAGVEIHSPFLNDNNLIVAQCELKRYVYEVCVIDLENDLTMTLLSNSNADIVYAYGDPIINNHGRAVYSCDHVDDNSLQFDMCSVNADGTGSIVHTLNSTRVNLGFIGRPSINEQNDVAYPCASLVTNASDICISHIESDGSLTESRVIGDWTLGNPSINNENKLVTRCFDLKGNRNICYHDLATGEMSQLTFLDKRGEISDITSQ